MSAVVLIQASGSSLAQEAEWICAFSWCVYLGSFLLSIREACAVLWFQAVKWERQPRNKSSIKLVSRGLTLDNVLNAPNSCIHLAVATCHEKILATREVWSRKIVERGCSIPRTPEILHCSSNFSANGCISPPRHWSESMMVVHHTVDQITLFQQSIKCNGNFISWFVVTSLFVFPFPHDLVEADNAMSQCC